MHKIGRKVGVPCFFNGVHLFYVVSGRSRNAIIDDKKQCLSVKILCTKLYVCYIKIISTER
jgi:hypothetical protein